jgi:hypothetical protein
VDLEVDLRGKKGPKGYSYSRWWIRLGEELAVNLKAVRVR